MTPELLEIHYQYKCRFCGETFSDSGQNCPELTAKRNLIDAEYSYGDTPLTKTALHDCAFPGQTGIADIVGLTSASL